MHILHVSHGWGQGGSQLYAAGVANAQASLGNRVQRFGPDGGRRGRRTGFEGGHFDAGVERRFAEAVRGVEVVHLHHLSGLSLELPRIAREAGALVVFTLHDYWLACARGQLVNEAGDRCPGPSTARCAACLAPDLYAPLPRAVAKRLPTRSAPILRREAGWASVRAHTHAFFAPSRHVAARLGVEAIATPLPLLRPIPPAPPAPAGGLRLLFLGSLIPTKGVQVLLDAFAGLPAGSASLRITGPSPPWRGSGGWAEAFAARAAAVPGVSLAAGVSPEAVVAELHEADVLVVPSTWEENAPLVLAEAAAAGLRVVASEVGGIPELAPDAVLVPPGSVPELRAALVAEVRRGRGRLPPRPGGSMAAHAGDLLGHYARLRSRLPDSG